MKIALLLVVAIAALAYAEDVVASNSQEEVTADVSSDAAKDTANKSTGTKKRFFSPISNIMGRIVDAAEGVKNDVGKKVESVKNAVSEKVTGIKESVDKELAQAKDNMEGLLNPFKPMQTDFINELNDALKDLFAEYQGPPIELGDIKKNVLAILDNTKNTVDDALNDSESSQSDLLQGIKDTIFNKIKDAVAAIIDAIKLPTRSVKDNTEGSDNN